LAMLPGSAVSQQQSLKEQLIGTWTLVSTVDVKPDGSKVERWGANPKGMLVFDGSGHYSLMIVRANLPKFAANAGDQGTADESQAGRHSCRPENCQSTQYGMAGFPRSVRLGTRELHHLGPLLGFIGDELAEVGRRAREHRSTQVGKPRLHFRVTDGSVDTL